jgi:hypothetical protein
VHLVSVDPAVYVCVPLVVLSLSLPNPLPAYVPLLCRCTTNSMVSRPAGLAGYVTVWMDLISVLPANAVLCCSLLCSLHAFRCSAVCYSSILARDGHAAQ